MVSDDDVAILGSKRLIEFIPKITFPENMVLHSNLQSWGNVFEIVEAMRVQPMRRVDNLKTSSTGPIQEPLEIWNELDALQLALNIVVDLPLFGQKVVKGIDNDEC